MEVVFRKATLDDVEGIVLLCNKIFKEDTKLETAKDVFLNTINDKNQIYVVGLIDNKIVAHMKISIIQTMYEDMGTYAILNHVCVDEGYRRKGLATQMLKYGEEICKENNCKKMELWSRYFREAAHALYKTYGFVIDDAAFFSKEI